MLTTYLEQHTIKTPDGLASLNDLVGSYRVWLMLRGHRPSERSQIEKELKELGYQVGQFYTRRVMIVGLSFYNRPKYEVVGHKIVKRPQ